MKDPWGENNKENIVFKDYVTINKSELAFEDNFTPLITDCLPHSKEYLDNLELKLKKLKKETLLKQLESRHEQCMKDLLNGVINIQTTDSENIDFVESNDDFKKPSKDLIRCVKQADSLYSIDFVQIIKYDQLQENFEEVNKCETIDGGEQTSIETSQEASIGIDSNNQ